MLLSVNRLIAYVAQDSKERVLGRDASTAETGSCKAPGTEGFHHSCFGLCKLAVGSSKWEDGCRMIGVGFASFYGLGWGGTVM